MDPVVGILGFQGCIEPHENLLRKLGVQTLRVRTAQDLASVDRLILPGGESTTMLRFLKISGLCEEISSFAKTKPVWGICAGAILAARVVRSPEQDSLNLIDIEAHRNFYGSQLDSFTTKISVAQLSRPIEVQFIRAPKLALLAESQGRPPLTVMAEHDGHPVFLAQGHIWTSSFHVELGEDTSLHELFLRQ